MSEPTRWGPPGPDAASGPTVPIPAVHRPPAAPPPGAKPTARYPTREEPAFPTQVDRDDHGHGYPDDDPSAYRDDDPRASRERRRAPRPSGRPRTRGQVLAGVILVLALAVSALLAMSTYHTLASVDLIADDPFAGLSGSATVLGAAALGALVVFVLAVIALVIARPKVLAGLALAASLLLPVGGIGLGVWYGGAVLRQNVENDLAAGGSAVSAEGAAAAETVMQELERRGVDPGPLRDLIIQIAEQVD